MGCPMGIFWGNAVNEMKHSFNKKNSAAESNQMVALGSALLNKENYGFILTVYNPILAFICVYARDKSVRVAFAEGDL